jgi:holin-like protein
MLRGILVLLIFQGIGEYVVYLGSIPIPSSVVGMLLFFLALLAINTPIPPWVEKSSDLLIRFLYLFLIPSCVGCLFLIQEDLSIWVYILSSIFVSTLLTLFFGSLIMKFFLVRHDQKIRVDR